MQCTVGEFFSSIDRLAAPLYWTMNQPYQTEVYCSTFNPVLCASDEESTRCINHVTDPRLPSTEQVVCRVQEWAEQPALGHYLLLLLLLLLVLLLLLLSLLVLLLLL